MVWDRGSWIWGFTVRAWALRFSVRVYRLWITMKATRSVEVGLAEYHRRFEVESPLSSEGSLLPAVDQNPRLKGDPSRSDCERPSLVEEMYIQCTGVEDDGSGPAGKAGRCKELQLAVVSGWCSGFTPRHGDSKTED